ncbi:helix-turn-helix transcriptional regulator [Nostoc sp. CMAA1605]|uniref:helix-turn-helix transcriptional regulator n=1 Tax=Nostoc sp. CMAA1605 TaxID=2055159 RepID=UPI001F41B6A7|nr:LuxR C-terminal-related transcriptional regulator [Nostoc sp. CMAA1605]MCF4966120.1 hypothetical protein [Nostoc sp. CMAA1605]
MCIAINNVLLNMDQQRFNTVFKNLTPRRKEVLLKLLASETDEAIATSLHIAPATVRKHREEICKTFGLTNEFPDQRRSKFKELITLFAKYKPELLNQENSQTIHNENKIQDRNLLHNYYFLGRDKDIVRINEFVNKGAKVILIQAEGGVGKTTLARKWFEIQGLDYLELRIGTTSENLNSVEDGIRFKLRDYFKINPEPNFLMMLEQLKKELQTQRVGILIDNLESCLINGEFVEQQEDNYIELLKTLFDSSVKSITLITTRELIYDSRFKPEDIKTYHLEGLKVETWREYFEYLNIDIEIETISQINQAYGGNAEAMSLICADIQNEEFKIVSREQWHKYKNDLLANPKLENLVKRQFDKLKRDNPQAYKLLCRLGCYRYQYISAINEEEIFHLLWDEKNDRNKRRFIRALRDRALLKFSQEGYYLYEAIRQEAIERLKLTDDWKKSHTEAGIFFSSLITNQSQLLIPKIIVTENVNNSQEQMYLNIENADKIVKQGLNAQETLILEVIYHAIEFYGVDSFEELRQEPNLSDNPFFQAIKNMVFEYIDCYTILGVVLYKFSLSTHILAIINEKEGNYIESSNEFEYSQRSYETSQYFFETALLIATRIKEDKLMINVLYSLGGCHYFRGISLHQLGIFLHQIKKNKESKVALETSEFNLEKSLKIFTQILCKQQIQKVQQAIDSLSKTKQTIENLGISQ